MIAAIFILLGLPLLSSAGLISRQAEAPPACFSTCKLSAESESMPCTTSDPACICGSGTPETLTALLTCLHQTCTQTDYDASVAYAAEFCAPFSSLVDSATGMGTELPCTATASRLVSASPITRSSISSVDHSSTGVASASAVTSTNGSSASPVNSVASATSSAASQPTTSSTSAGIAYVPHTGLLVGALAVVLGMALD